jgi:hypothetical protein
MITASNMNTITTAFECAVRRGDRVKLSTDTNRIRRRIVDVGSADHFETATYIRPSKGFARHVRRMKAKR